MKTQNYRPDIDGLRAIAVLLVVFFHADFAFFSGGFIGVDVFFVLSGYLITTIIYREITNGTFTYRGFYTRRICRLMPALFSVFFITTIAATLFLLPSDLISYANSLLLASISLVNIYFWQKNGGYFEGNSHEVPLLHTWSLSVEEQYYFLWPVCLMFCLRFLSYRILLSVIIMLFFLTLLLSEWVVQTTFGAAYYLLPTRIFELLVGSILAIAWDKLPSLNRTVNNWISVVGIALIFCSAIILSKHSSFPGFNALYAAVGSGLLILSGKTSLGTINKVLSLKPFVFIGLISYSLYLWHWPLLVFIRYVGIELTTLTSSIYVLISVGLAWLNWKYIEKRYRYLNKEFPDVFKRLFLIPLSIVVVISGFLIYSKGIPERFSPDIIHMQSAVTILPFELRKGCHSPSRDYALKPSHTCHLGDRSRKAANIFMLGDSHANHFTGFMDELANRSGDKIQDYTLDACIPIFGLFWGHNQYYGDICKKRNEIAKKHIEANEFDAVILAGNWPTKKAINLTKSSLKSPSESAEFREILIFSLSNTIETIQNSGAKAIILKDGAAARTRNSKCPITKKRFNKELVCGLSLEKVKSQHGFIDDIFDELQIKFSQVLIIDPKDAMCDDNNCYAEIDGIPLYIDRRHLNDVGSRKIALRYLEIKGNPLKNIEGLDD